MAKKTKTIAKLVDAAAVLLQKYVRLKAMDEQGYVACVTCGAVKHWKDHMHGGHFVSRAAVATKLMEENVHPQCSHCNSFRSEDMIAYTLYMQDMYGRPFVEELQRLKSIPKKYTRLEVEEIIQELRQKIKELE